MSNFLSVWKSHLISDRIVDFIGAALLATIATAFIYVHQCRRYFSQIRQDFIAHLLNAATNVKNNKTNNKKTKNKKTSDGGENSFVIGFFHPHCSSGGGGERVLWKAIEALGEMKEGRFGRHQTSKMSTSIDGECQNNCKNIVVVIYTVDEPSATYEKDLLTHVRERFSITIPKSLPLHFVHLHNEKHYLQKSKRLTLIAESLGTMRLVWCALSAVTPHIFFDTTGCAFTFFVAKLLAGCKVGAYVHYPTISTDMLSLVWKRRPTYNNDTKVAANPMVTYAKLIYYVIFAFLYGLVGSLANLVMVNSTWTKNHIDSLWKLSGKVQVVFPPVDTKSLEALPLKGRENMIISIGQFRPEKDHALQLHSFAKLWEKDEIKKLDVKLVLIGSCRGEDDRQLVDQLRKIARELDIQKNVDFVLNQPYSVLKDYFRRASIGIHTMWNEHFGIGVVEMMAAGMVTIAHNSGGPESDIIQLPWNENTVDYSKCTGCLASSDEQYAELMGRIFTNGSSSELALTIRENGRKHAEQFSDEIFMDSFKEALLSSSLLK